MLRSPYFARAPPKARTKKGTIKWARVLMHAARTAVSVHVASRAQRAHLTRCLHTKRARRALDLVRATRRALFPLAKPKYRFAQAAPLARLCGVPLERAQREPPSHMVIYAGLTFNNVNQ